MDRRSLPSQEHPNDGPFRHPSLKRNSTVGFVTYRSFRFPFSNLECLFPFLIHQSFVLKSSAFLYFHPLVTLSHSTSVTIKNCSFPLMNSCTPSPGLYFQGIARGSSYPHGLR